MFAFHAELLAELQHGAAEQVAHGFAGVAGFAVRDGAVDREMVGQGFDMRLWPARRQAERADQGGFNQHAERFHKIIARRIQNRLMENQVGDIDGLGTQFGIFHAGIGGLDRGQLFLGRAFGGHGGGVGFDDHAGFKQAIQKRRIGIGEMP